MISLEFIGPPKILGPPLDLAPLPPNLIFCSGHTRPPRNYFGLKFLGPPPTKSEIDYFEIFSHPQENQLA